MPPKADPYATRSQRAVDILLVLLTALVFFVVIIGHGQNDRRAHNDSPSQSRQVKPAH